jgi:hypothetical protein
LVVLNRNPVPDQLRTHDQQEENKWNRCMRRITGEDMGNRGPQKLKAEASVGSFLERMISARHDCDSANNLGKSKNLHDVERTS